MSQALLVVGGESTSRPGWTRWNLFWGEPLGTVERGLSIGDLADAEDAVAHDVARRGTGTINPLPPLRLSTHRDDLEVLAVVLGAAVGGLVVLAPKRLELGEQRGRPVSSSEAYSRFVGA